ncbi:MAG: hypothetical protein V3W41_20130 [Planctomycetota bacterium]
MRLRFLHLADVFLGCQNLYLGDRARDRNDDFRASFRDAIEYALNPRHEIDGVLISGNLFDSHRPSEDLWNFAKGLLSRLLAKDILVAIVPGQHDSYAYKHSVWRTERLPGVELLLDTIPSEARVHSIRGQRVFLYGLAYVPGQTPLPLPDFPRNDEKGLHIALVHGREAAGASAQRELTADLAIDLDRLGNNGFDYVALGGQRSFEEQLSDGKTTMAWPGSLEGRGFEAGETGDKGPLLVEFDDDGVHLERLISNRKSIQRIKLDLKDERITDADALANAIRTLAGRDAIVEVTLTGTAEFLADLEEIQDDLCDQFYHLAIRDESRIANSALLRKIESENTIRGYYVRKLGERIAEIQQKIKKKGQTKELLRELSLHENALKIGVEQFIEEESPADSIYSLIPDNDEKVNADNVRESMGVSRLEERVKAMLDYRRGENDAEEATGQNKASGADASGNGNGHQKTGADKDLESSQGLNEEQA